MHLLCSELGDLSAVQTLHLQSNELTGSIPVSLGNLPAVQSLFLDHNNLEGAIPQVLCGAVLCCAVLCCAVLCCAVRCGAVRCCAVRVYVYEYIQCACVADALHIQCVVLSLFFVDAWVDSSILGLAKLMQHNTRYKVLVFIFQSVSSVSFLLLPWCLVFVFL
jgi:hypothetical protein